MTAVQRPAPSSAAQPLVPPGVEPVPSPDPIPEGFWEREASHYPRPMTPLGGTYEVEAVNKGVRAAFDMISLPVETLEFRLINGRAFNRLVPPGGKDRKAPPPWLMRVLVRAIPSLRSRLAECARVVREDRFGAHIDRWYDEWRPDLIARIDRLDAVRLDALSDDGLLEHLAAAWELMLDGHRIHFLLHGTNMLSLGEFYFTCRDLLGWDEAQTFALVAGLSTTSTEPARRLAELAALAQAKPAVRELLSTVDDGTLVRLRTLDPEFATALDAYQQQFGCRCLSLEIADPTLREVPAVVLSLLADQIARGFDPAAGDAEVTRRREAAVVEARAALAARLPADRERFERVLARAERLYPIREENEFYTISAPLALLRFAALEAGRRLQQRGAIARTVDVFFLQPEEVRAALLDGRDRRDLVRRRQGAHLWYDAQPEVPSYGKDPGPPPPAGIFPREVAFALESLSWFLDRVMPPAASPAPQIAPAALLGGIAAAPGSYTGPARVIVDESEFDKIQAGDVLVCPITSPVWSVLFPSVGALVTDTGGILSHPAIIAREYGIPAVVGTRAATSTLRDGQLITVDGTSGSVTVAD